MKLALLITTTLLFGSPFLRETPNDFDSKLSDIVRNFKVGIMDKDECEKQKRAADDLSDEIEDAIKEEDEHTPDELIKLEKLRKEAEALEAFIAVVGDCGNYIPSIDMFKLANRRVRANVAISTKDKYCIDIISVNIGDFVAYLGENNSSKNYTISYKWKSLNGLRTGSGTAGLLKHSVRHIYNNRENSKQKNVSILSITCQEF